MIIKFVGDDFQLHLLEFLCAEDNQKCKHIYIFFLQNKKNITFSVFDNCDYLMFIL